MRFLMDEAKEAGESMAERTVWRISSTLGWWSLRGKKRGSNGKKPGRRATSNSALRRACVKPPRGDSPPGKRLPFAEYRCWTPSLLKAEPPWGLDRGRSRVDMCTYDFAPGRLARQW